MTEITNTTAAATTTAAAALKAAVDDLSYAAVVKAQEKGLRVVCDCGPWIWAWGPGYGSFRGHDEAARRLLSLADAVGAEVASTILAASRAEREATWTGPLAPPKTATAPIER